ncbi:hypothetical protein WMF37_39985 [Sorangium sp. So ce291]
MPRTCGARSAAGAFHGVVISTAHDGKMAWNRFYLDEVADR